MDLRPGSAPDYPRTNDFLPGDVLYFRNPDVDPATLQWQRENAVVLGDGTYYGHGIGITTAEGIIAVLSRHRRPGSMVPPYLLNQATRPDFAYLSRFSRPYWRVEEGNLPEAVGDGAGESTTGEAAPAPAFAPTDWVVARIGGDAWWIAPPAES